MLRSLTARAALALAVLLVAPACSREGTVDFTITETHTITNVATFGPDVKSFNLADKASEAWSHRDKIKAVRVTGVTVSASNVTNTTPGTTITGTFAIRPSGTSGAADVLAGSITTPVPVADGQLYSTGGSDALNAAVDAALKGDGQLSGVAQATATNPVTATLTVVITGEVDYKISAGL
jgi:hypothetical protein